MMTDEEKLTMAREEIRAVLKKHDLAGMAVAAAPHVMVHVLVVEATWTCATVEESDLGKFVRISSGGVPEEKKKEVVTHTVGLILGMDDVLRKIRENLGQLAGMLFDRFPSIRHVTRATKDLGSE
jgi:hypothetical protein